MSHTPVVVVGGGVIGCAIARDLARKGWPVTIIERSGFPGTEASWAAAGMLSPLAEADSPGPFLQLLLAAREYFPALARELLDETGIDIAYDAAGTLIVAFSDEDEEELDRRYRWQRDESLPVERLSGDALRRLEPAISPRARWGLRLAGDHQVDNRKLSGALWSSAARAGAELRTGTSVDRVVLERTTVRGVRLRGGEWIDAHAVVIAGGAWSDEISGLPRRLPVEPVHGQLLALQALPPPLRHVVDSPRCYLVPRADGRLIVGATVERRGYIKEVTAGGLHHLLSGALEIVPEIHRLPIAETWSGLRPGTPDELPILGADPEVEGLYYATGHYRNGILLAPVTGAAIGELIREGATQVELRPFAAERFSRHQEGVAVP